MQLTTTRAKWLALSVIGGATIIVACSAESSIVETGGSFGRAGGVGPVGTASTGNPTQPPRCPADTPTIDSGCGGFASICTYGPDLRDECVEKYECYRGIWEDGTGDCQVQCPKTFFDIVPGTPCDDSEMACSYDEGTCGCFREGPKPSFDAGGTGDAAAPNDAGDGGEGGAKDGGGFVRPLYPGVWKCVAPPTDPACPSTRPRVLDECVKAVTCDYGSCELGLNLSYRCQGGVWQEPAFPFTCE